MPGVAAASTPSQSAVVPVRSTGGDGGASMPAGDLEIRRHVVVQTSEGAETEVASVCDDRA
jgi:hypothetical protein